MILGGNCSDSRSYELSFPYDSDCVGTKKAENLSDRWPMVACWVQLIFFKGVEGFLENQTGLWMEAFLDPASGGGSPSCFCSCAVVRKSGCV